MVFRFPRQRVKCQSPGMAFPSRSVAHVHFQLSDRGRTSLFSSMADCPLSLGRIVLSARPDPQGSVPVSDAFVKARRQCISFSCASCEHRAEEDADLHPSNRLSV